MRAAVVPANSFVPPFDDYDDSTGERIISSAWKAGGHTDVHENFVRLTNDRQSKVMSRASLVLLGVSYLVGLFVCSRPLGSALVFCVRLDMLVERVSRFMHVRATTKIR